MRRRPYQTSVVTLTTLLMLAVTSVPALLALGPDGGRLTDDWFVERFDSQDENVRRAIASALATRPASVDQFIVTFLGELDTADENAARDVLALVLPRMSLERFLSGGWLVDCRWLVKTDRSQTSRDLSRALPELAITTHIAASGLLSVARSWSSGSSNLTRWQIRDLITALPLGP